MKVAFVGWDQQAGGLGTHCMNLLRNMPPDIDIDFFTLYPQTFDNINVRQIKGKNFFQKMDDHYDILHMHDWMAFEAAKDVPVKAKIITMHSTESMRSPTKHSKKIAKIEKEACHSVDKIISVSHLLKNRIIEEYDVPAEKIQVIYNSVAIPKLEKRKQGKKILFVGRLSRQKGPEYLMLAASIVLKRHPDAEFIFVGDGPLKNSLESMKRTLGLSNNISIKGYVSNKKLSFLYNNSTIFIQPSVCEPFGIAILEAASYGMPIISTHAGAFEILQKGYIEIQARNSSVLAENIIKLLDNAKYTEKLGNLARKNIERIDTWETIAKKTSEIYSAFTPKTHYKKK